MNGSRVPLYVSPRSLKSLFQAYRIYPDRLELDCWFAFRKIIIPAHEIVDLSVRTALVFADLFRGKSLAYSFPLKMDGVDMCRHVALQRRSGPFKHLRFTPDDPDRFVEICRTIMR